MSAPDANEKEARLPQGAQALLEQWSASERSALDFEQSAGTIMERVRETRIGSTPGDLLEAPDLSEPGEPRDAAEQEEPGLADIARAAIASGATVISAEDARDVLRAAEQTRHAEAAPWREAAQRPSGVRPVANPKRALSAAAVTATVASEASAHSEMPRAPSSERRPGFAAGMLGGAALAFAAAAALYVTVRHQETARVVSAASSEPPRVMAPHGLEAPVAQQAEAQQPAPATRIEDLAEETTAPSPIDSLPGKAPSPVAKDALAFRVERSSKDKLDLAERTDDAPVEKKKKGIAPSDVEQLVANEAPAPPALAAPLKQAAPAQATAASVAATPSLGAIQAAVGSVMPGARSCLAGQETGSKARVTFGSDGRVKNVGISGPAAGTPAEGCLRAALSAARVSPFSEPDFSMAFTVRPP
jgi:hypothetical protein